MKGISTLNDDARQNLIAGMKADVDKRIAKQAEIEAKLDAESQVKEEEKPAPDMRDAETFRVFFEQNNKHLGVYFTPSVMS